MIEASQIERIAEQVARDGVNETVIGSLRAQYPDLHFTFCMDDDVTAAAPIRQGPGFNLYLVDGRNHCLCFTQDAAVASGLVVAEVEEQGLSA